MIPGVRDELFRAAERVLLRDGPQAVSGRAVTREAGVATGLLYNYFSDLDEFLVALVVDRFRIHAELATTLMEQVGTRTVEENLVETGLSLLTSPALALAGLVLVRPTLHGRVRAEMAGGAPGLEEIITTTAAYLEAEKRLGRVSPATDSAAVALAFVGTLHHVLLTHDTRKGSLPVQDPAQLMTRLVRALLPAGSPDSPSRPADVTTG
jgi:AcrR family transcriptional regulator